MLSRSVGNKIIEKIQGLTGMCDRWVCGASILAIACKRMAFIEQMGVREKEVGRQVQ